LSNESLLILALYPTPSYIPTAQTRENPWWDFGDSGLQLHEFWRPI